MTFNPSRRFLILPAWAWLLLPAILSLFSSILGRPAELADPQDMSQLLRPTLFVAREGGSFRFLALENRERHTPHWAISYRSNAMKTLGWRGEGDVIGFWERSGKWTYSLEAHRIDSKWNLKEDPYPFLPHADLALLRPMVVQELNRVDPNERRGDRLSQLLDNGIERSSRLCVQNAAILLVWLSLPMALLALVAMFIEPTKRSEGYTPHAEAAA